MKMNGDDRFYLVLLAMLLGMLLAIFLINVAQAKAPTHVVDILPGGRADPEICVIDRNDRVAFRNLTDERIWLYLPWGSAVNAYQFVLAVDPGEISGAVEWNMDNVHAGWTLDGNVIVVVKTTDDPPAGSCISSGVQPWRLTVGGLSHD